MGNESHCCATQGNSKFIYTLLLPISILLTLILYLSQSQSINLPSITTFSFSSKLFNPFSQTDSCIGRHIYIHDLPSRFNSDLLHNCTRSEVCKYAVNSGFGPVISETEGSQSKPGWYATNQFMLEVIYHTRMKQYKCLTTNSSLAIAIYVPFYAGLDIGRYLYGFNISTRDSLSNGLIQWLTSTPEWKKKNGTDHFIVSGRVAWDMKRALDDKAYWGGKFLILPETRNMNVLSIEVSPWEHNEFGVPYPTYFHPSNKNEIVSWQEKVRSSKRPWLFTFVGARRPNQAATNIRERVIDQCVDSILCKFQSCGKTCRSPTSVIKLFSSSKFCLQPPGDSYTRKSTFDSILTGCIPVFFHPWSAHDQYKWYLPRNYTTYSVYVPQDDVRNGSVNIEETLLRYSEDQVRDMREELVKMIPRIVYKDYSISKSESFKDAIDVAIDHVIQRTTGIENDDSP